MGELKTLKTEIYNKNGGHFLGNNNPENYDLIVVTDSDYDIVITAFKDRKGSWVCFNGRGLVLEGFFFKDVFADLLIADQLMKVKKSLKDFLECYSSENGDQKSPVGFMVDKYDQGEWRLSKTMIQLSKALKEVSSLYGRVILEEERMLHWSYESNDLHKELLHFQWSSCLLTNYPNRNTVAWAFDQAVSAADKASKILDKFEDAFPGVFVIEGEKMEDKESWSSI